MAYVENRIVHDADSHLMELADCLDEFLDPKFRERYDTLSKLKAWPRDGKWATRARALHDDPDFRAGEAENILLRKNYEALGSFRRDDRPKALDQLGFASQLIFTTWCLGNFELDETGDLDLCYATAQAHNRMMTWFCSVDRRMLATGYVPLADFDRARSAAREAIDLGAKALLVPSRCPQGHSPSHVAFDPIWAMAQEAGLPIVFHVGGEEKTQPRLFRKRLAACEGFPRRRGELHLGQLHAHPAFGDADTCCPDLRWRARPFPEAQIRRHRTGWILAAELDALSRCRLRRLLQKRRALEEALAETERIRANARSASHPIPTKMPAGSSPIPARRSACSHRIFPMSKAAAIRSSVSTTRWRTSPRAPSNASSATISST